MDNGVKILAISAALVWCGCTARAQPGGPSAFEVAAVRLSMPNAERMALMQAGRPPTDGITYKNGRVDIGFQTLGQLIYAAFSVRQYQVDGPDWLISEMKSLGLLEQ